MSIIGFIFLILLNTSGLERTSIAEGIAADYEMLGDIKPSKAAWDMALKGYNQISQKYDLNKNKPYLTVIDFTLPSTEKRLWLIDVSNNSVLIHTFVAHGKNTGDLVAELFSNKLSSYQSSLGFYITGGTYVGKNGYSLYLDGIEKGINDKARERAIVMHGAWYANASMIEKFGRLGRSYGCPSVPEEIHRELIDTISEKTVLFIYHSSPSYSKSSIFY